jgi:hypothetical protein
MSRKKMEKRRSLVLYLAEVDYLKIVAEAGDVPLSKWARKRLLNGESGDRREVVLQPGGEVRSDEGRKPRAAGRAALSRTTIRETRFDRYPGLPNPKACVNCDHLKIKHGGFGGACQVENCLCGKFE